MAQAFILSHGARVSDVDETFVPPGRSISFFSEFDENTLRTIGMAALSDGSITPTETYNAGDPVPNYYLSRFSDAEMAHHLAMHSSTSGGPMYLVGDDLDDPSWLCTTPDACAISAPDHDAGCTGVFARIAESDIKSVSCRGVYGEAGAGTRTMEGSTEFQDEIQRKAQELYDLTQSDPDAAMNELLGMPEATLAIFVSGYTFVEQFMTNYRQQNGDGEAAVVTEARNYLEQSGDIAFASFADQYDSHQRQFVFAEDDLLNAYWLGTARRTLREDGAPAYWDWFRTVDSYWQQVMSSDDELMQALGAGAQGADVAEQSNWQATDEDFETARSANEPFVKDLDEDTDAMWHVGGFVVLLGDGGGDLAARVRQQPDYASGTFQVKRSTFGAGRLEFAGVAPMHQGTIEQAVAQFSNKTVEFT